MKTVDSTVDFVVSMLHTYYMLYEMAVKMWSRKCLSFRSTRVYPQFLVCLLLLNLLFSVQCLLDHCLFFCHISFGHCIVCPSSIYGTWLPLWYLQTLLPTYNKYRIKMISLKLGFELDPVTIQLKYIKSMLITYHEQYENEIWPPKRVLNDIHPRLGWSTYNQEETIFCLILWLYFYEWRHDIAEILLSWRSKTYSKLFFLDLCW